MTRKKRVSGNRKVRSLRASEGSKGEGSTPGRKRSGAGGGRWRRGLEAEELRVRLERLRELRRRPPKKRITLSLDADVVAFFKDQGPRYQRLINETLRGVMEGGEEELA